MEKKVVIIGAGIAGLSAGCYGRMNGYDVEIHETHNLPGGLCTSWKRGGYVIDGCIHWLTDSRPGTAFYRNWNGTYMTWMLSSDFQRKHRYIPKTVPGLSGFYLASMWTNPPGGISGAAGAGRGVVQLLCHEDRKRFLTSTP